MKKRLLSTLLTLCMVLALLPATAQAANTFGTCGTDARWTFNNGTLTIQGTGDMAASQPGSAPWYDTLRTQIKTVIIEDGITHVGHNAFYNCTNLKEVTIPSSVTTIGNAAFSACRSLTGITIPDSVTFIGSNAFDSCTGLTSMTIPSRVNSIQSGAFRYCSGLTSINIPDGVTSIASNVLEGCRGLTSINIPDGTTSIGASAFAGCTGLTSLSIPSGVASIGDGAFSGCTGLTSMTIPDIVTSIENNVFSGCTALASVNIPSGVTSIGESAFSGCQNLTGVTIPDSVTSIKANAFSDCRGLTGITIPNSVTSIGEGAFSDCTGLSSVTIPNKVTSIESKTFSGCTGLTSVTIPVSVANIASTAFVSCSNIKEVYYGGNELQWASFNNSQFGKAAIHFNGIDGFADVPSDHWANQYVTWAVEKNITAGTSATTFSPDNTCTKAQILAFLWRANGSPETITNSTKFTDIQLSDYYYKAALWAEEKGMVSGTTFDPQADCTRAMTVEYLWKLAGSPAEGESSFTDVSADAPYFQAVAWAVKNDVTSGMGDGTFAPNTSCTRAQIVTFLYRALAK